MKNYLFVCSANRLRSPYAEEWTRCYIRENRLEGDVMSAGLYLTPELAKKGIRTEVVLTENILKWSDMTFVMQEHMAREIAERFPGYRGPVVSLNVPDRFSPSEVDADIPTDITYYEALEYANTPGKRFGRRVFEKILETTVVPYLEVAKREAV